MTDPRAQSTYQVRLGWGSSALAQLEESGIVVIVDAIDEAGSSVEAGTDGRTDARGSAEELVASAVALPHRPTVYLASLRNATATAQAIFDEQLTRGGRTAIDIVLTGDAGAFAVEDYLVAGALGDALSARGLDHSAPDVAVAIEGFRALKRALKHLLSASAAGLALAAAGRRDEVRAAAELDADADPIRVN